MREHVKQITESLMKVIEKSSEKSEASKKISTIFEDLSRSEYSLSNKTLKKLINIHQQTGEIDKQYSNDMRMSLIFFLKDCDGDLEACLTKLSTLQDRKLKIQNAIKEKALSNREDEVNLEYAEIDATESNLVVELDNFKIITNKNIKYLFEEFFKTSNTYNGQVAYIWNGTLNKQSEILASQNENMISKN